MGIVIIGTGLAGYTTARELRKQDKDAPLTLVSADSGRAYSKPLLSTGYRKEQQPSDLVQAGPEAMAEELNATVITATAVASLEREQRRVRLTDGNTLTYDRLVLALGADPMTPRLGGDAADAVFQVNDLDQYERFRAAADPAQRVLIMGGGLIGCEFANDLALAGYIVDLVFPEPWPLPRLLTETPGRALYEALVEQGVRVHSGGTLAAVDYAGEGLVATCDDGTRLQADVVLAAIGLRPRTNLAAAAGLECGAGIRTDRWLASSDPAIAALGDCAEVGGYVLPYVAPINQAARALGRTLAGEPTPVHYPVMPVSVKTSCCPVVAWPPEADAAGTWSFDGDGRDLRGEFRDEQGALEGFVLTGKRIKERMSVTREMPPLLASE